MGKKPTGFLKRSKRRWSPLTFHILENGIGPFPKDMEKIVSDSKARHQVYYNITGPGVNQNPVGLFSLNCESGMLMVNRSIDREEFPSFNLKIKVFDKFTHMETDSSLDIQVIVEDVNDNAPTFIDQLQFTVLEQSVAGTVVGKVNATDRDLAGTLHTKIKYFLTTGLDLFDINPETGVITTKTNTLDREAKDKHMVTVVIKDMGGADTGLSTTGTATITVGDINDNVPTLTKTSDHSVSLGPLALLAMLLPLLFLLLLGLLLVKKDKETKREKLEFEDVGDSGGILLKSNTESPGEEVDSSLITIPTTGIDQAVKGVNAGWTGNKSFSTIGGQSTHGNGMYGASGVVTSDTQEYYSGQYDNQFGNQSGHFGMGSGTNFDNRYLAQDAAFLHNWRTNGRYINQKLAYFGTEDGQYADDLIHSYGFEGAGSAAGSVGCCSDFGDNDNLDFLNTLGPKFKTLGAVCRKT